jgi:hypothetical protein
VIEPDSRVVDLYFFESLLDIFHGLHDVPSAVLLHVVLRQNAMSDPASDTQWSDMDGLWKLLWTNCLCCGAHILV